MRSKKATRGFSLVEMLIALVIFVIGLLAIALLQLRGLSYTRDAGLRTTAITVSRSLADHIRGNYGADYQFNASVAPAAVPACAYQIGLASTANCACARRTDGIIEAFTGMALLPPPSTGMRMTVALLPTTNPTPRATLSGLAPVACAAYDDPTYLITLRWSEGGGQQAANDQQLQTLFMP